MRISVERISDFLFSYAKSYRKAYAEAITPQPMGPGYPAIVSSPFLDADSLEVYIANDGIVLVQIENRSDQWYIAGGPALKIDYEPSRTPDHVLQTLIANNLLGKSIGISRIVAKSMLPDAVWRGEVQGIEQEHVLRDDSLKISLYFKEVNSSLYDIVNALTFGAFGSILNVSLPDRDSQIGDSQLIRNLGMFPADLSTNRFFRYLEIFGSSDDLYWDTRILSLRIYRDLRRDLAQAMSGSSKGGGTISLGGVPSWIESYGNQLKRLQSAIADLKSALQQ